MLYFLKNHWFDLLASWFVLSLVLTIIIRNMFFSSEDDLENYYKQIEREREKNAGKNN